MLSLWYYSPAWKSATVVLIPKPGKDKSKAINYRSISLLPALSKVAEKVLNRQIQAHLDKHKILINAQYGLRKRHNTTAQAARIINDVVKRYNERRVTFMALLDYEKAFDKVWFLGLIHKLVHYEFPDYIIKTIKNYLTGRKFQVKLGEAYSPFLMQTAGAP